jgi:hypothetical protein
MRGGHCSRESEISRLPTCSPSLKRRVGRHYRSPVFGEHKGPTRTPRASSGFEGESSGAKTGWRGEAMVGHDEGMPWASDCMDGCPRPGTGTRCAKIMGSHLVHEDRPSVHGCVMRNRFASPFLASALLCGAAGTFSGCVHKGPAARAGQGLDRGVQDARDAVNPPGTVQKAGRAVDRTLNP